MPTSAADETVTKAKAGEMLGRALGVFKDKDADINMTVINEADLDNEFEEAMRTARERQERVLRERGLLAEDE